MMREVVWVTTALLAIGSFGIGNALGQLQRSQIERLTGQPEQMVTPPKQKIDPNKLPLGWSLMTPTITDPNGSLHPYKVVLGFEAGGFLSDHYLRFQSMVDRGQTVEVRQRCISACTLVTMVARKNLCFGPLATLEFHLAWDRNTDTLNYEATWGMYRRFPEDIRAWIDRRGGVDRMPKNRALWVLEAPELWAMGYKRCAD